MIDMRIENQVLETIRKHNLIQEGESVVIGVSGGPDSVCLLYSLHSLAKVINIKKLYAVHINHMLRGDEARLDEEYVAELCARLGVEVFSKAFDIEAISRDMGLSLEETGREIRYKQFQLMAESTGAEKIAVAHNRNDQAETILMNIIRGAGLEGLKGMDYSRGNIIRPLLDADRREIEIYCNEQGLHPRTDSSNLENIYTRNKIRLDLIPYIDGMFQTDIAGKLIRTSFLLRDDNEYIEESTAKIYNQCVASRDKHEVRLKLKDMRELHRSAQKRIIRNSLREVKGDLKGIENVHIEDALNILRSGRTGAELHLPKGIRITRSYDVLIVSTGEGASAALEIFKAVEMPGRTLIDGSGVSLEAAVELLKLQADHYKKPQNSFIQFFDYDKLKEGINIRNRMKGDIFKPCGSIGTKKLKEYFIDNKIPREERDKIPVVARGNEIVWIVGCKISDKFKVTENTKSILKLEYICEKTNG